MSLQNPEIQNITSDESIIDKYFKFFTELKEIKENVEKFDIDWIYLKKKEDDLILHYFEKIGYNYNMTRPTIISKELKYTKPDNTDIITTIQTYNDSFINNVEKYYPNIGKSLNEDDIKKIIDVLTSDITINNNDLFEILSEKILYIIDKYKESPSLIYDNIILILDEFDCNKYFNNIKAYYIAVKIIYINNKNFYFSTNFQFLIIATYIILSKCIKSTDIIQRLIGSMTYDIIPGNKETDQTGQEKGVYTYMGILMDTITNNILKIVTLNKYNFATENDYNITKIVGKDIKNLYSAPTDPLGQSEQLLNGLTKYIKNLTTFDKPVKPTGGKRGTMKKRRNIKKNNNFKKTFKNKKMKGGFIGIPELMASYYYVGTYGPAVSGLLTGYGLDRAKLIMIKILLEEIHDNEPFINSDVYRYIFNINNPLNNDCTKIPTSSFETYAISTSKSQQCRKEQEQFKNSIDNEKSNEETYNKKYDVPIFLKNKFDRNKINYKECNIDNLKYLLEGDVENGKLLKEKITFFVNILNIYSNLYISKCTNITKFDYNDYNIDDYNIAFQSIEECFIGGINAIYFNKLKQIEGEKKSEIIKKMVDILREEKTNYWNKNLKKIICPEGKKGSNLSGFIKKKFIKLFEQFKISDTTSVESSDNVSTGESTSKL